MIELSPTTALMVYLGIALCFLLGIWLYHHYGSKSKVVLPVEKNVIVCEFCHFAYLGASAKEISRCPRCSSYNRLAQH